MATRRWLRSLHCPVNVTACGRGSGHPAWIVAWLAVSAALVLFVPDQFEKTVRLTRGSIQRADPDGLRHGGEVVPDVGTTTVPPGDRVEQVEPLAGSGRVGAVAALLPAAVVLAPVFEVHRLSLPPASRRRSTVRPFLLPLTHAPPVPSIS
jgi:hypothetical protein